LQDKRDRDYCACTLIPLQNLHGRRGSTVRVRQRAS
jgi:hypothetical protein